jgi:hypothetical protein
MPAVRPAELGEPSPRPDDLYHVRTGPFSDIAEAEAVLVQARNAGYQNAKLVRDAEAPTPTSTMDTVR